MGHLRRVVAALLLGLPLLVGLAAGAQAQTLEFLGFRTGGTGAVDSHFDGTYEVEEGKRLYGKIRMNGGTGLAGVGIRVTSGTATAGQDYGIVGRANIPSGSTTGWFAIRINDDAIADDVETITLEFYEVTIQGGFIGPDGTINTRNHGTAEITIRDYTSTDPNDYAIKELIWLSKSEYNVTEGGAAHGEVRISTARGVDTTISLTESGGTAASGTDYSAGPYSVTIPAGRTSAAFSIQTTQDTVLESQEAFRLRIDTNSLPVGYEVGTGTGQHDNIPVKIEDDESELTFDLPSYSVREDAGEAVVTLSYSRPTARAGTVKFVYTDVTATGGSDYTQKNAFPDFLDVPAGTEEITLRIPVHQDNDFEENEIVNVTAIPSEAPTSVLNPTTNVIITSVDPDVDFQASAFTAHEGREAVVTFRTVEWGDDTLVALRKPTMLHVRRTGGTATPGTDFAAGPWTLTIPKGASKGVLRIPIHADSASDDGETIDLEIRKATGTDGPQRAWRLADASGGVLSGHDHIRIREDRNSINGWAQGVATVTINDGAASVPGTPVVWIEADSSQVTEGTDATFTLKTDPAPLSDLDVSIHVGDVTEARHVAEEDRGLQTATIPVGMKTGTLTVPTEAAAGAGAVRVVLMGPDLLFGTQESDYAVGKPSTTLVGVDGPPPLNATPVRVPNTAVTNVQVTAVDDTSAKVTWDAVEHATGYQVLWDVRAGNPPGSIGGGARSVTGTTATIDHFAQEAITLSVTVTPEYADGNGDTQLLNALAGTATLTVVPAGTQSADTDDAAPLVDPYAALIAKMVEWRNDPKWARYKAHTNRWDRALLAFGESVADSTLTPMTAKEAQAFADRGWTRWVEVATALQEIESGGGTEEGSSDDTAPATIHELGLSAGPDVDEGGSAEFTITADPAPQADLTVELTVAQSGDYLSAPTPASQTVTLTAGTTTTTLSLATVEDGTDEPDGSVRVTIEAGTGYTVAAGQASGSVIVHDNDELVVSIAAGNGVTEGDPASFTVTATPAPAAPLTVALTVDQSGDYAAAGATGAREIVVPTEGSVIVEVATDDDDADEPNGSISATLTAGSGYTVAAAPDNAASVGVTDDDEASARPMLSIGDETLHERDGLMWFTVRLSTPSDRPVSVSYHTRESTPASAREDRDYLRTAWHLDFRPGETEKRFWIYIFNDSHDEDPETFEMALSRPTGGVVIDVGVAVGTIVNSDPMPKAWLSRFGRTVAQQALDGITGRLAAPRTPGAQGTLAGQAFTLRPRGGEGTPDATTPETPLLAGLAALGLPGLATGGTGTGAQVGFDNMEPGRPGANGLPARTLTLRDVLLGSSFSATGQPDAHGGSFAFWGRAAQANFEGREGTFALDGETTTAMLGTDYARDRWLLGVTLLQSLGTGGYDDPDTTPAAACADLTAALREVLCGGAVREGAGSVESTLTAAVPYAAFQASERLKLWGAAGYGAGEVTLTPETGGTLKTDLSWSMAELGLRGQVLAPADSGPALAVTSDALWTRTSSEKVQNGLAASESDVTRLRLGLEGSWLVRLETLGQLTPTLAVGARHDGGDAETGFGVELGGGLAWNAPRFGLALNLEGRTLLTHRDEDFQDQGVAASFAFDPDPATPRGPSLTVRQDWGGQATGGVDALFAADPLTQRQGTTATSSRWAAEAAWGFPAFGGRFTGSPHMGVGLATGTRDYSLGWRLVPATPASALSLDLQATRREMDAAQPEHRVGLEITTQW